MTTFYLNHERRYGDSTPPGSTAAPSVDSPVRPEPRYGTARGP